eukprot:854492-Rhodomonas_salina.1
MDRCVCSSCSRCINKQVLVLVSRYTSSRLVWLAEDGQFLTHQAKQEQSEESVEEKPKSILKDPAAKRRPELSPPIMLVRRLQTPETRADAPQIVQFLSDFGLQRKRMRAERSSEVGNQRLVESLSPSLWAVLQGRRWFCGEQEEYSDHRRYVL